MVQGGCGKKKKSAKVCKNIKDEKNWFKGTSDEDKRQDCANTWQIKK